MKCLTLTAPWSWLVAGWLKGNETRGWTTKHRGLLGIHTAQSLAPIGGEAGLIAICSQPWFREAMIALGITNPLAQPRGCIIAVCNVVDVQPVERVRDDIEEMERQFGDYSDNRFAWQLGGVARLRTPIIARGGQGLWTWNGEEPRSLLTPAAPSFADLSRPIRARRPASMA